MKNEPKRTLYHPTLPATQDVSESEVPEWTEAGWRKTPPTDSTVAATAAGKASDNQEGQK